MVDIEGRNGRTWVVGRVDTGVNAIRCSDLRFPLIAIEFIGTCSDEQFVSYLQFMAACRARAKREAKKIAIIVDTLQATRPVSAKQRQMQADEMKNQDDGTVAGMAFVIDSPLVRGVLTAILWVQKMPWDYCVSSSRAEAEEWALGTLNQQRASGS